MHVCVHTKCTCTCMYACMCVCICVHACACVCAYVCMHVCVCVWVHVCMHVSACVCLCACVCESECVCPSSPPPPPPPPVSLPTLTLRSSQAVVSLSTTRQLPTSMRWLHRGSSYSPPGPPQSWTWSVDHNCGFICATLAAHVPQSSAHVLHMHGCIYNTRGQKVQRSI